MTQKIIKVGNSLGIVIPKDLALQVGIKAGNEVFVEKDPNGMSIVVNKNKVFDSSITPDFLKIVGNINKKYGPALSELAGKGRHGQ